MSSVILAMTSPNSRRSVTKRRMIDLRPSGFSTRKPRSSSSSRIHCMPIRPASGAKMSMVSRALRCCFSGAQVADRPHVVQPVGELDEQDAQVLRHRHQELAEVLRLLVRGRGELEVGELGHPVDQLGDLLAEAERDLGVGRERVLDGVVQERGDDRRVVELLLGEQDRHRDRMGEVGLAVLAELPLVHLPRVVVGGLDQAAVGVRVVGADEPGQGLDRNDAAGSRPNPGRRRGQRQRLAHGLAAATRRASRQACRTEAPDHDALGTFRRRWTIQSKSRRSAKSSAGRAPRPRGPRARSGRGRERARGRRAAAARR